MAEYVSNTFAQLLADFANACIRGPAMRTIVAAEFNEVDLGAVGSQSMVPLRIDGAVKAVVHGEH
jgi:hypothetical protein